MNNFIQKYDKNVNGVLSGFDRLVLRGTLRALALTAGMFDFLYRIGVLLKNFGAYVENTTAMLKEASLEAARRLDRPVKYLASSQLRKETIARNIAKADGITGGLICILTCVEPCMSYLIHRSRERKRLELQLGRRKCLHLYHYWIDSVFGFMHARIQTWFPFTIQVCLNGREYLATQMDRAGMKYTRRENCFPRIEDVKKAQELMDKMLRISWPSVLRNIARRLNPAHDEIFDKYRIDYYWSTHQSEWATDVMFDSPSSLESIYAPLVRGAIASFSSPDVMRFLGKKPNGNFLGEVVSDYRKRPEGVRVKHSLKANSVKVYDKQGSILRVETTINDPYDFKVFRTKEGSPNGQRKWLRMRKGVADLHRRAQISDASNQRYLDALASLDTDSPLSELVEPVCRPVMWKCKRVRALRPWSREDSRLLSAVGRGEFVLNGFRNGDILPYLFPGKFTTLKEKRRASARVSHRIRMLRAHGIIRKVPRTRRYTITQKGRQIIMAVLELQHVTSTQLMKAVA